MRNKTPGGNPGSEEHGARGAETRPGGNGASDTREKTAYGVDMNPHQTFPLQTFLQTAITSGKV